MRYFFRTRNEMSSVQLHFLLDKSLSEFSMFMKRLYLFSLTMYNDGIIY